MILLLIFLILYTTVLYISPELMSNSVTFSSWLLFIIYISILIVFIAKYRKKSIFCPELLFSITFLFSTFLYSPFLYGEDIDSYVFKFLLQESNVNIVKGQSIAMMGFFFYLLGAVIYSKRNKASLTHSIKAVKSNSVYIIKRKYIHMITTIFIFIAIINGGLDIINRYTDTDVGLSGGAEAFFYITILIVISSVVEFLFLSQKKFATIKSIIKNVSKLYIINISFMITLFLLAGYRSALFPMLLPFVFLYDRFVKKIKIVYLISFLVLGVVLMSIIKDTRAGNDKTLNSDVFNVAYIGGDFTAANQALFTLVENTDKYGSQQGRNAITQMVSFIPFAQSFLIEILGLKTSESSSSFFTDKLESYWSGLGTHVIGDLYYGFGWFGVVLFMFVMGGVTSVLYNKATHEGYTKVIFYVLYLLILGNSLMFSRVEFFYFIRYLGFAAIILWLLKK